MENTLFSVLNGLNFNDEDFVYTFKNIENTIRDIYGELRKRVFEYLLLNVSTFPHFQDIKEKGGNTAVYSLMNKLVDEHNDLGIDGLKEIFKEYDERESMVSMVVYSFIHDVINENSDFSRLYDKYSRYQGDVMRLGNDIIKDVQNHIFEYEPHFYDYATKHEEIPTILH